MSVNVDEVMPWGRSLDEYRRMFNLTEADLARRILGCGDGPASFNVEMKQAGHTVVSVDPVYALTREQLQERIGEVHDVVVAHCRSNQKKFVWQQFRDADELGRYRLATMQKFLDDLAPGLQEKRYVIASLPALSFADGAFDLAVSSHFLFLYTDQLPLDFHLAAIREMCRVAGEARIFPLVDLHGGESAHVRPVMKQLRAEGWSVDVVKTSYEFQRGANRMLRVAKTPAPAAGGWRRWLGF